MTQIGQTPSPAFQQPLELLSDCHRRVKSFLSGLILVSEQAATRHAKHRTHHEKLKPRLLFVSPTTTD